MNKINLVELLKDCPSGMELDCVAYDNVSFDKISDDKKATYPIFCYITDKEGNRSSISFTENGCESKRYGAKCVIFPKGKTTWEGFQRPFVDGDILYIDANDDGYGDNCYKYIFIFKKMDRHKIIAHCYINMDGYLKYKEVYLDGYNDIHPIRFATEEEKQKLFQAIKDNGYKWNAETKTLEKLIIPKFKDGDILYLDANDDGYGDNCYKYIFIFKKMDGHKIIAYCYITMDGYLKYKEVYLADYSDIHPIRFATEEEKQKLFNAIKGNGYKWNAETKTLEKLIEPKFKVGDRIRSVISLSYYTIVDIKDGQYVIQPDGPEKYPYHILFSLEINYELVSKFDINTLKPFESRVLVRDYNSEIWRVSFWGCLLDNNEDFKYDTVRGNYKQCIPYEGNEHLLGKTDDCNEFYKVWE